MSRTIEVQNRQPLKRWTLVLAIAASTTLSWGDGAVAQLLPDRTLGTENSVVVPLDPLTDIIDGGAIRGSNLFHSFQDFNVGDGRTVDFSNPAAIETILTRVTGSNPSNIFGNLGVLGNADLFLLNPNGIVFGPNAGLNLNGSFFASTAERLDFADGFQFSATNPDASGAGTGAPPLLTINVPIGWQFGANPGNILVQTAGTDSNTGLDVPPGNSFTLVGGDVTFDGGRANALGGRLELGGLSAPGTVGLNIEGNTTRLSFPEGVALGNVTLANDARVSVLGLGGGDIAVRADRFLATDGGRLVAGTVDAGDGGDITVAAIEIDISGRGATAGSGLYNQALPGSTGNLGEIRVTAGNIRLTGTEVIPELGTETGLHNGVLRETTGNAGNIFIEADSFSATSGAGVRSFTLGSGSAGEIRLNVRDIDLFEGGFLESVTLEGTGHSGNVQIETETLSLLNGSRIKTESSGLGDAGDVRVNAAERIELSGISIEGNPSALLAGTVTDSFGNAGDVTIRTPQLIVRDGASIEVDTSGAGAAGNLTIDAAEFVELSGSNTILLSTSGLSLVNGSQLLALTSGDGDAGNIAITTDRLTVRDGGSILAFTTENGNAGNIAIRATEVDLTGSTDPDSSSQEISVRTSGAGNAGNITLEADRLNLRDGAQISAASLGSGDAGSIFLQANEVSIAGTGASGLLDNSSVSSQTFDSGGNGGRVTLEADRLSVRDGGQISAATSGSGNAGSILVRADDVELVGTGRSGILDRSGLSTQTFGTGNGGNITVETDRLSIRDGAQIASGTAIDLLEENPSPFRGRGGDIDIRAAESLELRGFSSDLFSNPSEISSQVSVETNGAGGTVTIETDRLTVGDRATITVSSLGFGDPGSIAIGANDLRLDDRGSLTAESATGRGGNIGVRSRNIQLRRQSAISASGSQTNATFDGNLNIDAETLVLLEGSRIVTSAFDPQGGSNITIRSIDPTDGALVVLQSPDSLINARGELTIEGDIKPDPAEIPEVAFTDVTSLMPQGCRDYQGSEFYVTGRGGIPPSPFDLLGGSRAIELDWVEAPENPAPDDSSSAVPSPPAPPPLIEAQGWIVGENGQIVLTAQPYRGIPYPPALSLPDCQQLRYSY